MVFGLLFILGCAQLPANLSVCKTDSDCIPKPECHPMECINQRYESSFKKPEMCTEIFMIEAAYSKEDCACRQGSCVNKNKVDKDFTEQESRELARRFVEQSSTYSFDGFSLEYKSVIPLKCPQCWNFVFDFQSRHAGYGDRTDQVLAPVITPHTAIITVGQGKVGTAILDNRWDMIKEELIKTPEEPDPEKFCSTDQDCACGRHIITGDCFYGNLDFVDTTQQCPDFCNGIAANFRISCINYVCVQTRIAS